MMSEPGTPTLDQLRVFLTVVEVGSFAAATRKLRRATSVIRYSIANLELNSACRCLTAISRANRH